MANITITDKCNLRCPYCFADEFTQCQIEHKNMSFEDFVKAMNFALTSPGERIGIIGGEPTLHPEFDKFMQYVLNHPNSNDVILFSNCTRPEYIKKYLVSPKFSCLVNVNMPEDLGQKGFNNLVSGIEDIFSDGVYNKKVSFGVNIYRPEIDYTPIVDLCKRFKRNDLRVAIAVPLDAYDKDYDPLKYFYNAKPTILRLFEKLLENEIVPHFDCNLVSPCVWTNEETNFLKKFEPFAKKQNSISNLLFGNTCCPVLDILPDLTAVRCFGMSRDLKVSISDFNNINDLRAYFSTYIDSFKYVTSSHTHCNTCMNRKIQKCTCGCLAFKSKQIESIRKQII